MTVAELIKELEKIEDKSKDVFVYSYDVCEGGGDEWKRMM